MIMETSIESDLFGYIGSNNKHDLIIFLSFSLFYNWEVYVSKFFSHIDSKVSFSFFYVSTLSYSVYTLYGRNITTLEITKKFLSD